MQNGRVIGVGVSDFYDHQVVPFKSDHFSLELLGAQQSVRDLAWKPDAPEVLHELWRGLLAHAFHNTGCGDRSGIGETIEERSDAKEMVAVTVRSVDCRQVLAARLDPIHQGVRLLDRDESVV